MGSSPIAGYHNGGVVQSARTSACHAEGRGFESRHSRHYNYSIKLLKLKVIVFLNLILCTTFWSHRLTVRTADFQSANRGSIPRGTELTLYYHGWLAQPSLKRGSAQRDWLEHLPYTGYYYGWLAQLARASALQAGGQWFESTITHHSTTKCRSISNLLCTCGCNSTPLKTGIRKADLAKSSWYCASCLKCGCNSIG